MHVILLPWPHRDLSPNSRAHWAVKARHKAVARAWAHKATIADVPRHIRATLAEDNGPILMMVTFHPPDRRARDWDNCVASAKAAFDGVADGLGVDDKRFVPTVWFGPVTKPGCIKITIGVMPCSDD